MKKFALSVVAMAAVLFGSGVAVQAYPPGAGVTTTSQATVVPGGTVTISGSCEPGETVTVTLGDSTATTTCGEAGSGPAGSDAAAGGYSVTVTAPDEEGTATADVTGSETGVLGSVQVTVAATTPPVTQGGSTNGGATDGGTLPSTGSDGTSTALLIGFGSLFVGLGLFGTARLRRNQNLVAG